MVLRVGVERGVVSLCREPFHLGVVDAPIRVERARRVATFGVEKPASVVASTVRLPLCDPQVALQGGESVELRQGPP